MVATAGKTSGLAQDGRQAQPLPAAARRPRGSGTTSIYSHQLAHLAGVSAAQVRRDFMVIGYSGSPNRGYQVDTCLASIESLLDGTIRQDVALVGLGRLGRSVLAHFAGSARCCASPPASTPTPTLIGTSVEGCPVHAMADSSRWSSRRASAWPSSRSRRRRPRRSRTPWCERACAASWTSPPSPCGCPEKVFVGTWTSPRPSSPPPSSPAGRRWAGWRDGDAENGCENGAETEMDPIIQTIDSLLAGADMKLDELARRIGARF